MSDHLPPIASALEAEISAAITGPGIRSGIAGVLAAVIKAVADLERRIEALERPKDRGDG